jgi:hypothetical protein
LRRRKIGGDNERSPSKITEPGEFTLEGFVPFEEKKRKELNSIEEIEKEFEAVKKRFEEFDKNFDKDEFLDGVRQMLDQRVEKQKKRGEGSK